MNLNTIDEAAEDNFAPALPQPERRSLGKWHPVCSENVKWARTALESPIKYV